MPSLPIEVLLGVYLGLLAGILPALVAGSLGFVVRYFTGVTLPGFGVVVLALAVASVNGGLLVLVEPDVAQSPRLLVAVIVVIMLSLYAHNQGDALGQELPRHVSFTTLRKHTLSADVVEFVGGMGRVTVRPTGEIQAIEGYPPLSPELRATIRNGSWPLPADLPLAELEIRLEERLRTDYDLADVTVRLDENGRATIAAAPPSSGLSRRVPTGHRAVSIDALVPTGLARGDDVLVGTPDRVVEGTVLSVRTDVDRERAAETPPGPKSDDSIDDEPTTGTGSAPSNGPATATTTGTPPPTAPNSDSTTAPTPRSPVRSGSATAGGEGRVTVTVPRRDARVLLGIERGRIVVSSRGTSSEFDALSLLREAGLTVRRVPVTATTPIDSTAENDDDSVSVLAVRRIGTEVGDRRRGWTFTPAISRPLETGDEAFVVGHDEALDRFEEGMDR